MSCSTPNFDEEAAISSGERSISDSTKSSWKQGQSDFQGLVAQPPPLIHKKPNPTRDGDGACLEVEHTCNRSETSATPMILPDKRGNTTYRFIRWTLLSTYRRLFSFAFFTNMIILAVLISTGGSRTSVFTYSSLCSATSVNILVAIAVRHEHIVNVLFIMAGKLPHTTPLRIRCWAAKIYSYGGIHSGCALAAMAWYLSFAYSVVRHCLVPPFVHISIPCLTLLTSLVLATMCLLALPSVRHRSHDLFEASHRFGGWSLLLLFWTQSVLLVICDNDFEMAVVGNALIRTIGFWCLLLITYMIIYPWLRLRRRQVHAEVLSPHAIRLWFRTGRTSYCQGLRVADQPLMESHAFAPIPNARGTEGFSCIVSDAGDWTHRIIQNPPTTIWTRGGPQYGALYVAQLFNPVIIVATGSGIGPCLSLFQGRQGMRCRILWSARSPLETYGEKVVREVLTADEKATIIDTKTFGRPDLVDLTYRLYREAEAEGVVIISNRPVTRKVVHGLESRGVPTFGPIFDS